MDKIDLDIKRTIFRYEIRADKLQVITGVPRRYIK